MPGTEGLLHISQIAENRIRAVADVLSEGDLVAVKVIEIDPNGKVRLSRKSALRDQPGMAEKEKLAIAPARGGGSGPIEQTCCPTAFVSSPRPCPTSGLSRWGHRWRPARR